MTTYNTNLAAEYYVLSVLYRKGLEAYLTLGNKKSIDIILQTKSGGQITIDVKGVSKQYDWPADNITKEKSSHYYIFVCFDGHIEDHKVIPSSWVVPADKVKSFIIKYSTRSVVSRKLMRNEGGPYKDNWDTFE
jgi:hypothetical protein